MQTSPSSPGESSAWTGPATCASSQARPRSSVLATFDAARMDAALAAEIENTLEANHIVYFPRSPVPLPDERALRYLRAELPSQLRLKNVSYHPDKQSLSGLKADQETCDRTAGILREHLDGVTAFLSGIMPRLFEGRTGKTSFRPIQERGRNLKPHASNELVHIDAGAYGATNGDRILRFFVNVNEGEDRVWASKGPIQDVLDRHGISAGLLDRAGNLNVRIDKSFADHALTFAVRALSRFNPLAQALDSSPYDRAMRRLHNYMKDSEEYKSDQRGYEEIRFPPGSAWMVFTDGVSHASLSGQFALVTTMVAKRADLRYPHFAPYNLLAARN
jgi:hypothetical protein